MSKTWFITGTSSGFGRIMTEKLLARGDRVVGTLRKQGALDDLKGRYGDLLTIVTLDVTDGDAVDRTVKDAFEMMGRIDVVINNAGYGLFGAAEEVSDEQICHQIDTNLIGSIRVVRAVLPYLRAQGGGRILQVASEGGQVTYPNFSVYHATKWGIEGFIESVAQEVAPFGIECTILEPGPSKTDFGAGMVRAPATDVYADTPSGAMRRAFAAGTFTVTGDAQKFAQAMIDSLECSPAPKRLTLGSIAFGTITAGLTARLTELEGQREIALAADVDTVQPA